MPREVAERHGGDGEALVDGRSAVDVPESILCCCYCCYLPHIALLYFCFLDFFALLSGFCEL